MWNSYWRTSIYLLISGMVAALLSVLAGIVATQVPALIILIFITTFLCTYLGFLLKNFLIPAALINIVSVASILPANAVSLNKRFVLILTFTVVLFVARLGFIRTRHSYSKRYLKAIITRLGQLLDLFWRCYQEGDYFQQMYLYEKKIHKVNSKIMKCMTFLRCSIKSPNLMDHVERLYEVIIALGELRFLVTDHATFELIHKELAVILSALKLTLKTLVDQEELREHIDSLEEINRSIVQVVAPEPLVFALFINNLKQFSHEVNKIAMNLHEL